VIDFIDMDESKNRREVENRLRDALRQDRARVQFGTISKFGLMEMSRQRLKPALSEGSSIPCPRCGGSGHIRDTESSALQILRIIQEEALKDNTAAVRCQVPVEVASFLLNEKRSEIAKIELKQRVNVLMVPNKTLETPNYKLERLKHDDPRLDHIEASYTLAEEIEDPTVVTRRSQEPTNRQTPVIKGVLPDAPAPVSTPRPAPAPRPSRGDAAPPPPPAAPVPPPPPIAPPSPAQGFIEWLKRLFGLALDPVPQPTTGPTAAPVPTPAPAAEPQREAREPREGRGERRGGRRNERGERTDRGEARGERGDRPERGERSERANRENREPRESRDSSREGRESREPRESRDGERRPDRAERGNGERRDSREVREPRSESREFREDREPRDGRRGGRDRDREGAGADLRVDEPGAGSTVTSVTAVYESSTVEIVRGDRGPRRERGERSERRNERAPRPAADAVEAALSSGEPAAMRDDTPQGADRENGSASQGADAPTGERRERKSRDRYGRDRRDRSDRSGDASSAPGEARSDTAEREAPAQGGIFDAFRAPEAAAPQDEVIAHGSADPADLRDSAPPAAAPAPEAQDAERQRAPRRARTPRGNRPETEGDATAQREIADAPVLDTMERTSPTGVEQVAYAVPADEANASEAAASIAPAADGPVRTAASTGAPDAVRASAPAPDAPTANGTAAASAASGRSAFVLPIEQLQQVARSGGLEWVQSDAGRIAAAQASIAAEPQPVRVPRERPPAAVVDAGPLVLVETRRDLRDLTLPFEQSASAAPDEAAATGTDAPQGAAPELAPSATAPASAAAQAATDDSGKPAA
jgi:ribonuclease E